MELKDIQERRAELIKGLEELFQKADQIKVAIEVQKGAITDCDYWAERINAKKEEKKSEPKVKKLKEEDIVKS